MIANYFANVPGPLFLNEKCFSNNKMGMYGEEYKLSNMFFSDAKHDIKHFK